MKKRQQIVKTDSALAHYLTAKIDEVCARSNKDQTDIAHGTGYKNVNNITMLKQGLSKLPLQRAPLLAKQLEIEPIALIRMALEEYSPEVFEALSEAGALPSSDFEIGLSRAVKESVKEHGNKRKTARDPDLEAKIAQTVKEYFS